MEKLTDAEVVKALECCGNWQSAESCDDCPANTYGFGCAQKMAKHTLDLINRKDAEIERLQAENTDFKKTIENMTNEHIKWGFEAKKRIENAKSEAYREFAERVKNKIIHDDRINVKSIPFAIRLIHNTLKELTEGKK